MTGLPPPQKKDPKSVQGLWTEINNFFFLNFGFILINYNLYINTISNIYSLQCLHDS